MTITLETELVRQCAPTLAGLKAANLFRFRFRSGDDPFAQTETIRHSLAPKGIQVEILSFDCLHRCALLYVYRPHRLSLLLADPESSSFLKRRGYRGTTAREILHEISLHLACRDPFPHEIGILLDYPLEDVKAYMAAPRDKGVCSGCWKAYGNREQAECYFAKCQKCTRIYWRCYRAGTPLSKLAVA